MTSRSRRSISATSRSWAGNHGTFIVNGTERVIVSRLHRSPGAFFHTEDKTLYVAQIIPYRGSWVEFEYDAKNLLYVRIDRKRKFLATVFLRALGLRGADEILRTFHTVDELHLTNGKILWKVSDHLIGRRSAAELPIPGSDLALHPGKKIRRDQVEALRKAGVEGVELVDTEREGAWAIGDVVDATTGEVILEANEELSERVIAMAQEKNVEDRDLLAIRNFAGILRSVTYCCFFSVPPKRILSRRNFLPALLDPASSGRVVALFMTAGPVSGVIGGPISRLAPGLESPRRLAGWQWMFLLEAIPAILLGFATWFSLRIIPPARPGFSPAEKSGCSRRSTAKQTLHQPTSTEHPGLWFANSRLWGFALVYFGLNVYLRNQPLAT